MAMEHTENKNKKSDIRIKSPTRLLTIRESARYLGRSEASIRALVYKRIFPVIQEGKRSKIWLDVNDLDEWIDNKKRYL
jgi:predicted DNA-binding transcriptional regulator AlpA